MNKTAILPALLALLFSCSINENITIPEDCFCLEDRNIHGIGIIWSDWLTNEQLPLSYRSNPRSYDQAQLAMITAAGGDSTHVSFDWIDIEPVQGTYDWSRADEKVEDALEKGLTIYAYIGNTPDWAVPPGEGGNPPLPGYRTPPDEAFTEDFENYCRAVADRYKMKVNHFFFWNEPNGYSWVKNGGSNSDGYPLYTKWLKRAYTALKEGNQDCTVAAGSIDYNEGVSNGFQYLEGIYNSGGYGYFDAFDIHPYSDSGLNWSAVDKIREVLVNHGDEDIPIWISEYGWPDSNSPDAPARLASVLTQLKSEEYNYVTYARYLVLSDLPGGTDYGMVSRDLTEREIFQTFKSETVDN